MGKLSYAEWIRKESINAEFKRDVKKRKTYTLSIKVLWITVFLVICGMILVIQFPSLNQVTLYLLVLAAILVVFFISANIYSQSLKLTKKSFTIVLLYTLAEKFQNEGDEFNKNKELVSLVRILTKAFDKGEISSFYDSFEYDSFLRFKEALRKLAIYINGGLDDKKRLANLSGMLNKFAQDIYDEKDTNAIVNEIEKICKTSSEGLNVKGLFSRLRHDYFGYLIAVILIIIIIAAGIISKVDKNSIYAFITLIAVLIIGQLIAIRKS
jgi:hypothetical protein